MIPDIKEQFDLALWIHQIFSKVVEQLLLPMLPIVEFQPIYCQSSKARSLNVEDSWKRSDPGLRPEVIEVDEVRTIGRVRLLQTKSRKDCRIKLLGLVKVVEIVPPLPLLRSSPRLANPNAKHTRSVQFSQF